MRMDNIPKSHGPGNWLAGAIRRSVEKNKMKTGPTTRALLELAREVEELPPVHEPVILQSKIRPSVNEFVPPRGYSLVKNDSFVALREIARLAERVIDGSPAARRDREKNEELLKIALQAYVMIKTPGRGSINAQAIEKSESYTPRKRKGIKSSTSGGAGKPARG